MGPAYLRRWLEREGLAFEVFDTEAGQAYPEDIDGYAALAVLGGEMSANDDLPSLRRCESLIRRAVGAGVPVIGHCLGGQLMARALGARVTPSPRPEIGWQAMRIEPSPIAREWFGDVGERIVFQWHAEAFALPAGATLLASSPNCPNQAFALGPHLAMQFHVELDTAKLAVWAASVDPTFLRWQQEYESVQPGPHMLEQARDALPAQQRLADALYRRWIGAAVG